MPDTATQIAGMHPLLLLHDIEQRSKRRAFALPQHQDAREIWEGIGFSAGGLHMVTAMKEIREILPLPPVTRVFGAKEWVKGVANIRGSLLPVMDLQGFILNRPAAPGRRSRLLVVRHGDMTVGLIVDEVLGLRHFFVEDFRPGSSTDNSPFTPFLAGERIRNTVPWPVFSVQSLLENPGFLHVAAPHGTDLLDNKTEQPGAQSGRTEEEMSS